jgi:hypothetical protein
LNEEQELLNIVQSSFRDFLKLCFLRYLNLPEPTPLQYEIADYMQYGGNLSIILSYRSAAKSTIAQCFVCWVALNNSNAKFSVLSANFDKAKEFCFAVKKLISMMPILQHLEPRRDNDDRTSVVSFDFASKTVLTQDPSVRCKGIFSNVTGGRADYIICDDIEVPDNCDSAEKRERLIARCEELLPLRVTENSKVLYLGTPHSEDSIYNKLKQSNFKRRIWPLRYPYLNKLDHYDGDLTPSIQEKVINNPDLQWKSADPRRYDDFAVDKISSTMSPAKFMFQYMLDTTLSDEEKHPLKLKNFIIADLEDPDRGPAYIYYSSEKQDPDIKLLHVALPGDRAYLHGEKGNAIPYEEHKTTMVIDPSGRGTDETSYSIIKFLNSKLFIMDCGGYIEGSTPKTMIGLAESIKKYKVKKVYIEDNYNGQAFGNLLKQYLRDYPCSIDYFWSSTKKEERIINKLEVMLLNHKLVIDKKLVLKDIALCQDDKTRPYSLLYQLTHIARVSGCLLHDDRLDSLAENVGYFSDSLMKSEEQALIEYQQRLRDEEIDRFLARAGRQRNQLWNQDMSETW